MDDPAGERNPFKITEAHVHPHLRVRMSQRGITLEEVERTLNEGWETAQARAGTMGRTFAFPYRAHWEGTFFEEKEVTVFYKTRGAQIILLTVLARYGTGFGRR